LEEHEGQVRAWLGPINRLIRSGDSWDEILEDLLLRWNLEWIGDVLRIALALFVFGVLYSFVDPDFSFDHPDAIPLMLAVTLSIGLVNLLDDIAKLIYVRHLGGTAEVRVHGGNLAIAAFLVLFSRLASLTPGILSVGPGGFEGEERGDPYRLSLVGASAYALPAMAAWFLLLAFPNGATGGVSLWIATVLALIAAIGLQTVFFEMIPIKGFYGRAIFERSRRVWFALFAFFTFMFIQTQLNPDGAFLSAFQKPNMVALLVVVALFCLISGGIWLHFAREEASSRRHSLSSE
jgi:hypothetical protein